MYVPPSLCLGDKPIPLVFLDTPCSFRLISLHLIIDGRAGRAGRPAARPRVTFCACTGYIVVPPRALRAPPPFLPAASPINANHPAGR